MMFTNRERDNLIVAITQHKQYLADTYKEGAGAGNARRNSATLDYEASDKALNKLLAEHEADRELDRLIHD